MSYQSKKTKSIKQSGSTRVRSHISNILLAVAIPVLAIVLWFLASAHKWINPSILPSPEKVWASLLKLIDNGSLKKSILSSLGRVVRGYFIGLSVGLLVGILASLSDVVYKLIQAPVGIIRPIPAIALIPFFILWMGIGEKSKIAIIAFGTFWPVLLNTIAGMRSTDPKLMEVGRMLEKNYFEILFRIVIPSALPSIFTGIRLGMSSAWTCVVAAEMIAASSGIGFLITSSREMSQPASLFVGIAVIGIFGLIIDLGFTKLGDRLIFWKKTAEVKN